MKFFYSSGAMGYGGEGYFWHKIFNLKFPKFSIVTKTITLKENRGYPYFVIHLGNSVYNHNALDNKGFIYWLNNYYNSDLILSIHGTDDEIDKMVVEMENYPLKGIELNYSCPNVKSPQNKKIPKSKHDLYLKINCNQDPYFYELDKIKQIRLNSVPMFGGGISGKMAQKYNWDFIGRFSELNIAGCSFINKNDIIKLHEYYGINDFGIGSVMLINPKLICGFGDYNG
jgi:hypothetical protein